ncbi:MAG: hypothetical protein V1792_05770 [Pseudomonadota bacterium]
MAATNHRVQVIIEAVRRGDAAIKQVQSEVTQLQRQVSVAGEHLKNTGNAIDGAFKTIGATGSVMSEAVQGALGQLPGPLGLFANGLSSTNVAMAAAVAGATALTGALYAVTQVLAEARTAWSGQELAIQQIDAVWRSMGRSIPTSTIHNFASELQKASVYGDEQIAGASRILATFPQITDEMMKPAMQTMVDFAAFANTSLDSAYSFAFSG